MSIGISEASLSDIAAVTNRNDGYGNDMFGGNGAWWLIVLLLFGWGRGGYGGGSSVGENYVLATDFATIERKLDGINNGICDATFQLTNNLNGNFRTLDGAICNLGYQALQNASNLSAQLAQCCCDTRYAIGEVNTGIERTGWNVSKQISDCCCDIEKMNMQNRFDAQAYNCNTLQAIDKLGDRIESRMIAMETARTRELLDAERTKNAILQGQIDRAQLRYDIVNDVRPCPQPAYITCNPYAASYGCNPCGCGNGSF